MKIVVIAAPLLVTLFVCTVRCQTPPRLSIPGAIPIPSRPLPARRLVQQEPARIRRPLPNALPAPVRESVRPVVEEEEDPEPFRATLEEEVARLSQIPVISPAPRQTILEEEDDEPAPTPKAYVTPLQFRPERPSIQSEGRIVEQARSRPPPQPIRQAIQQTARPVVRPAARQQPIARVQPAQPQYLDEDQPRPARKRKPPVQILRKYRQDNEDGSITWGFENEDGTFKEENIGADCIIRGKYGYVDPEGNRREYTYESGNKCDEPEEELPEELIARPPPQPAPKGQKRPLQQQPQYRVQQQ